uniref:hypothetical protein n=1 Tax=Escherichia coli TaxID=562 RepID=UPI001F3CCA0F|nr:hypothetical protein [Escherichia coli]UGK56813.1 hypothetical protein [Escherichia coli]
MQWGSFSRPRLYRLTPAKTRLAFFDEVEDADPVLLSGNPFIKRWLHKEILKIRRLTYTRLDEELEKIAHYPDSLRHSSVRAHRLSLIAGTKTD